MVLCQIVAVDNAKGVIVRFVTNREAIEKSKISYNKGFCLYFIVPWCVLTGLNALFTTFVCFQSTGLLSFLTLCWLE